MSHIPRSPNNTVLGWHEMLLLSSLHRRAGADVLSCRYCTLKQARLKPLVNKFRSASHNKYEEQNKRNFHQMCPPMSTYADFNFNDLQSVPRVYGRVWSAAFRLGNQCVCCWKVQYEKQKKTKCFSEQHTSQCDGSFLYCSRRNSRTKIPKSQSMCEPT